MKPLRSVLTMFALASLLVAGGCYESEDASQSTADEPEEEGEEEEESEDEGGTDASESEPDAAIDPEPDAAVEPDAPPPPDLVDYATEIQPILNAECTHCHGGPMPKKNLNLTTYAGPRSKVTPCDCAASLLIQKIGPNPPAGNRMPADGPPYLSDAQQALICQWVNEGALETPSPGACP